MIEHRISTTRIKVTLNPPLPLEKVTLTDHQLIMYKGRLHQIVSREWFMNGGVELTLDECDQDLIEVEDEPFRAVGPGKTRIKTPGNIVPGRDLMLRGKRYLDLDSVALHAASVTARVKKNRRRIDL